jgi:hypothetical protein
MTDETGAQQGRAGDVVVPTGERETIPRIGHGVFGVSPVALVAGETRTVTEILPSRAAIGTDSAGPPQPGHSNPISQGKALGLWPDLDDCSYDLMA